jgi:hypothetical protein
MQDELKKVISQAMNTSSEFDQEPIAQFNGELSDEDLEAVAGGTICRLRTLPHPIFPFTCRFKTLIL